MEEQVSVRVALKEAYSRGELIPFFLSLESHMRRLEGGQILCELHNAEKISLTSSASLAAIKALSNNDFWSIVHSFNQAIPTLKCSHREVLKLVQTLVDKAGSDGAAGMPNLSLVSWCKENPEKAKQIIAEAKALDSLCLSHCAFAVQGLESTALALELLEHADQVIVTAGLKALGRLKMDSLLIAKRVINECYEVIATIEDQAVRSAAIETAFKTWEKAELAERHLQSEFIKAVIERNNADELTQLAATLFYYQKGLTSESIEQILVALTGNVSSPKAALHWLDSALYAKDQRWSLTKVIDVLTAQIPKLDGPPKQEQFNGFCQWIFEERLNFSRLLSRWLVSGQLYLCEFLVSIIGGSGKENILVEIAKSDLPSNAIDQIFMARKCVGFLWVHEVTAASILLSIVKNGKKIAQEEAENLLFDPLLLSYGGELRSFLEEQVSSESKRISSCVQRLLEKHDNYIAGIKQAEHLVEFLPSIEQRRAVAMKDGERNKEIAKQADEQSILTQITTRKMLLYGNKSFFIAHGIDGKKEPTITPLSQFSYSTELPRLSVIDSVGFDQMLKFFRAEKKASQ